MTQVVQDIDDTINRPALVTGDATFQAVTDAVVAPLEAPTPRWWMIALTGTTSLLLLLLSLITYLLWAGTGVWGVNSPVGWGFDIINFVYWVGIAHAGTLISAILFTTRQKWRTSISRFAEAMTIFAVLCALIYPGIHVGRMWLAYYMFPVPNQMALWPNFKSPLLWDLFAVSSYFTLSLVFWYIGMMPDLATLRDRALTKTRKIVFGILAMGWRGSARHWLHYEKAYLILAAMGTPLVVSVSSVVSMDFAASQIPGWHATIFPPYFVAGAVFSGFAMVVVMMAGARKVFKLENLVTMHHLETMNKIVLGMGMVMTYIYSMEFFMAWYSADPYEMFAFINRAAGPYAAFYWVMLFGNAVLPQLFWMKRFRRSIVWMVIIGIMANVGRWCERFVIVTTIHRDFLPSSWGLFIPTWVDIGTFLGTWGLFLTLFLLFLRFLPMINITEVKSIMPQASPHEGDKHV